MERLGRHAVFLTFLWLTLPQGADWSCDWLVDIVIRKEKCFIMTWVSDLGNQQRFYSKEKEYEDKGGRGWFKQRYMNHKQRFNVEKLSTNTLLQRGQNSRHRIENKGAFQTASGHTFEISGGQFSSKLYYQTWLTYIETPRQTHNY